jgi:hypothetical protein
MAKKVFFILAILLAIPIAAAASTEIVIKTLPNKEIFISIIDPSENDEIIEIISTISGADGKAIETFTGDNPRTFDLKVKVGKGANPLFFERFNGYAVGEAIEIELYPKGYVNPFEDECDLEHLDLCEDEETCITAEGFWYDKVCNSEAAPEPEPVLEETEELAEESNEEAPITGRSVGEIKDSFTLSNKMYWYLGIGLLALIIVLFVTKTIMRKGHSNSGVYSMKIKPSAPPSDSELAAAEAKIKEAQAELIKLKNKDRISEARKKLREDQETLRKLERGEV